MIDMMQAAVLGAVEGLTEFLPVSSTGHLTIAEKLLGMPVDDQGVTAFTAIIQVGAIAAVVAYFRSDIMRLFLAWARGLVSPAARRDPDYRFAWYIVIGSIPIGVVGILARDVIAGDLRSLWVVVGALLAWSVVMWASERWGRQDRSESDTTFGDALVVGATQCIALVPGVSRSGATISAGLLRGLDRTSATRLSFFLSIPALTAAGAYEALSEGHAVSTSVGWGPTLVATLISFAVAYLSIAWLLKLVASHSITVFIGYRVTLAAVVAGLLLTGAITAT